MIVYIIWNKQTGKCYVGQTTMSIDDRLKAHRRNKGKNMAISRAIAKHGWENFEYAVLEKCNSIEELNEAEKAWIKHYDSLAPNGYNIREGGKNGLHSERTKEKMRGKRKPYKTTVEGRLRTVEAWRLKAAHAPRSKESNEKRSAALKGRILSCETRRRMSESAHNKTLNEESVKFIKRLIHYGLSLSEIAEAHKLSKSCISMIKQGRNWKHVGLT